MERASQMDRRVRHVDRCGITECVTDADRRECRDLQDGKRDRVALATLRREYELTELSAVRVALGGQFTSARLEPVPLFRLTPLRCCSWRRWLVLPPDHAGS